MILFENVGVSLFAYSAAQVCVSTRVWLVQLCVPLASATALYFDVCLDIYVYVSTSVYPFLCICFCIYLSSV